MEKLCIFVALGGLLVVCIHAQIPFFGGCPARDVIQDFNTTAVSVFYVWKFKTIVDVV